jgi:hypothetical protein
VRRYSSNDRGNSYMTCPWKETARDGVNKTLECEQCAAVLSVPLSRPLERVTGCRAPKRCTTHEEHSLGPGDMLYSILSTLGAKKVDGCGCDEMLRKMNAWGADGCEEHFDEITAHLRSAYEKTTWSDAARTALAAARSGLALKLDWTDPIASIVRLAINEKSLK